MIIIESVRLRNFRAIKEAYFQPVTSGITGLFGSNGAGKSTLLAGILYSLFSIKPAGATTGSLRRRGTKHDEECSASIVFQHLGQQVEVIREIRGKNNTTVLNIYVDGVETTVTSVSSGDAWIRQRLGVDANGFLTAFVTRQKELDQIISATPAARKQIFEKLAGVETINEALKAARKNENDTKNTLENLSGSQREVEETLSQVEFLSTRRDELENLTNRLRTDLTSFSTKEKEAEEEVYSLRNMETDLLRKKDQLTNIVEADRHITEALYRLRYLDEVDEDFDIEELRANHRMLATQIQELKQEFSTKSVSRQTLLNKNQELIESLEILTTKIDKLKDDYEALDGKVLLDELTTLQEEQVETTKLINQTRAREQDLEASIKTLGHASECPTCHTSLENPEKLINDLTTTKDEYAELVTKSQIKLGGLTSREAELDTMVTGKRELEQLVQEFETTTTTRVDLLHNLPPEEELTSLQDKITTMEEELISIAEIGKRAASIVEDREERAQLQAKTSENAQVVAELHISIKELEKVFSAARLDKALTQLDQLKRDKQGMQTKWDEANREFGEVSVRFASVNADYSRAAERWKRKEELLKAVEQNALTTELIDKFRRETVASLTPELTDRASDLISEITSGAYTEIRIDDDFNITVINSEGDDRRVGELSGGEESAVALALRLAIGLLITGGQPSLLFMDEPFVSQDSERRMSMLETIQHLPYQQIILVSHDGTAEQVSDLSVLVKPNLKEGSTLEILSGGLEQDIIAELEHDYQENTDQIDFEDEEITSSTE